MQPSLTGTVWGTKTARPAYLSSRVRSWSRSRFMNTPPESATVPMPSRAQISVAMRAEERARRHGSRVRACRRALRLQFPPKVPQRVLSGPAHRRRPTTMGQMRNSRRCRRENGRFCRPVHAKRRLRARWRVRPRRFLAANAQNRGCGIKQATHAAGARAVDARSIIVALCCAFARQGCSRAPQRPGARAGRAR